MSIITAWELMPAMKAAIQADSWLGDIANVPTVKYGHSGVFDVETLPCPAIVLAPQDERNPYPPVSRNAQKLIRIMVHAYTEHYGEEVGLVGDDYTVGVMEIINKLEVLFDNERLSSYLASPYTNSVARSYALDKTYPDPTNTNYIGLNEARLMVEYLTINPALA